MAFQEHGGIVIYRSRAQQEIDKMIWDNPDGAAIFGYVMLIALATIVAYRFIDSAIGYRRNSAKYMKFAWPAAIAIGIPAGIVVGKLIGWLLLAI